MNGDKKLLLSIKKLKKLNAQIDMLIKILDIKVQIKEPSKKKKKG